MIKKNQRVLNIINVISDFVILFLSYLISTYIRFYYMYLMHETKAPALGLVWSEEYLTGAYIFAFFEIVIFYMANIYKLMYRKKQVHKIVFRIIECGFVSILILVAFLYISRIADFSRIAIAIYYFISTSLLVIKRVILDLILKKIEKRGTTKSMS